MFASDLAGDNLANAYPTTLQAKQVVQVSGKIGDGGQGARDVDLYRINLLAGQAVNIDTDAARSDSAAVLSSLDSYIRVFDAIGKELASNSDAIGPKDFPTEGIVKDSYLAFTAPSAGVYYIGVSGELESGVSDSRGNRNYDPNVVGSSVAATTGAYELQLCAEAPPVPYLFVTDTVVNEGNGAFQVKVQLSEPVQETVIAQFETKPGTATSGQDFQTTSGSITFPAGTNLGTIELKVMDDSQFNENYFEDFQLAVTSVNGIAIGDPIGNIQISNNDFIRGDWAGDYLTHARSIGIDAKKSLEIESEIGDGVHGDRDVDLISVRLAAGQILHVDVDAFRSDFGLQVSTLDSYIRILDSAGIELQSNSMGIAAGDFSSVSNSRDSYIAFKAPYSGNFFIGISGESDTIGGSSNQKYDPNVPRSGLHSSTGKYVLQLLSDTAVIAGVGSTVDSSNQLPVVVATSRFTLENGDKVSKSLTVSGSIAGAAASIEFDVNLDGSADFASPINNDGTYSVTFPLPNGDFPELGYAIIRSNSTSTPWETLDVIIPGLGSNSHSMPGVSLALERVTGDSSSALSGLETVRGKVTGNPDYGSVSLEIDYNGDHFADKYIDIKGRPTFNEQVFANAISSKGLARLNGTDLGTGQEYVTPWVAITHVELDASSGNTAVRTASTNAARQADLFGILSGQSTGITVQEESIAQAILKAASIEASPLIVFASTLSSDGVGRLLVTGKIADASLGAMIAVYRKKGDGLESIGTTTISDGANEFRLIQSGKLQNGDALLLRQHSGDGELGCVSKVFIVDSAGDDDRDGISTAMESLGDGDGNNDGILDSKQSDVGTLLEAATGTLATIDARGAKLVGVSNYLPSNSSVAVFAPNGLYRFEVHNTPVSGVQRVDVYLETRSEYATWMKLDPKTGEMIEFTFDGETGAIKTSFGFTIYLRDGARGDSDGIANGIVVDNSGPSFSVEGYLNIGAWPKTPELYEITVNPLPGVPTGLVWDAPVEAGLNSLPDSIKASIKGALDTLNATIASNQKAYDASVVAAQVEFDNAILAASNAKKLAVAKANEYYNAAVNGYLPADLAALRDAINTAQIKYREALAKSIKEIEDQAQVDQRSIMQEQAFNNAKAQTAYDEEVKRIQSQNSYSSSMNGMRPNPNAIASAMKDARVRRDTAIIKNSVIATTKMAELTKRFADAKADAAKLEYQDVLNAMKVFRDAAVDNDFSQKNTIVQAHQALQKAIASADFSYASAVATAKKVQDSTIIAAKKAQAKADNAANLAYGKSVSSLYYDAAVANEGTSTSRVSEFRKSVAAALRDKQHAELDAAREMRDSYIDADATFDDSVVSAASFETISQAGSSTAYKQALIDANNQFSTDLYSEKRDDAKETVATDLGGSKAKDVARRDFDKDLASVNKDRMTLNSKDLEGTRIAQTSNQASFDFGLIKEPEYKATAANLEKQANDILTGIAIKTFGTPPTIDSQGILTNPGTGEAMTESRAVMQKLVQGIKIDQSTSDAAANQGTSLASSVLDWTHAFESSMMNASNDREKSNDEATKTATEVVGDAADAWAGIVATAAATLTSKTAIANATYRIAIANASIALQVGLAQDRNTAIREFADKNPSNIWAELESAKSAAELIRTQQLAAAYSEFVGTIAPAQAAYTSSIAKRQAAFTVKELDATVEYEKSETNSTNLYKDDQRVLEAGAEAQRENVLKTFDDAVKSANEKQRTDNDWANRKLICEQQRIILIAKLKKLKLEDALEYKRNAEADSAMIYSTAVLAADVTHANDFSDALRKRSEGFADMSETNVAGSIAAGSSHENRLVDANAKLMTTINNESISLRADIAIFDFNFSKTRIDAEENFSKKVADCDAEFDKSIADAEAQFDRNLATLRLTLVRTWAGDGVLDPITRYEQFVIDAYAAQVTWTNLTSTIIVRNAKEYADNTRSLIYSYSTLSAIQMRSEAEATKALEISIAGLESQLSASVSSSLDTDSKGRSEATATAAGKTATANKDLGHSLAGTLRNYRSATISASATAAASIAKIETEFHRQLIRDDNKREESLNQVQTSLNIDLLAASVGRADGYMGAVDAWGDSVATYKESQAITEGNSEYALVKAVAAAFTVHSDGTTAANRIFSNAITSASTSFDIGIQNAYQSFVAGTGQSYITAVSALGDADQSYANTMAIAATNYHIGVQTDLVTELEKGFGPVYNLQEKWQIRVAKAQLDYLRGFAPHFQTYVSTTAKIAADLDNANASSAVAFENAFEAAMSNYVTSTGSSYAQVSSDAATDWVVFESGLTEAMANHTVGNGSANKAWVVEMAGVNKVTSVDRLKAETKLYREQAKQTLVRAERNDGRNPTYPISNQYENDYAHHLAFTTYDQEVGAIKAGAGRADSIIALDKSYVDKLAASQAAYLKALAKHNQALGDQNANAEYAFDIAIADAEKARGRAEADADCANHIKSAAAYSQVFGSHYATLKTIALSFSAGSSPALANQIVQFVAIDAWAQALGPNYVAMQTAIAKGAKDYAYTTTEAVRTAVGEYLDVVRTFAIASNATSSAAEGSRADADQQAIQANAGAQANYDSSANIANREYLIKVAELRRDARIAAKSVGPVDPDPEAMAAANKVKQAALDAAAKDRNEAIAKAISDYFSKGLMITKQSMIDRAEANYDYAKDISSAVQALSHALNSASRTFRKAVINAEADFEIAKVDAEITRLMKIRILNGDTNSVAGHDAAVAGRPSAISKINNDRADALSAADKAFGEQSTAIDKSYADSVAQAAASKDAAIKLANAQHSDQFGKGPVNLILPSLSAPGSFGSNVSVAIGVSSDVDDILKNHLFGDGGGEITVGYTSGLDYTGWTDLFVSPGQAFANFLANRLYNDPSGTGHLILDVLGAIPVIGCFFDLANAAWYAYEGDALNAGLSMVSAVPGLGYGALALKYGAKGGVAACRLTRLVRFADVASNVNSSLIGMSEGAYSISSDPTSVGGYVQLTLGAIGLGVNARSVSKGFLNTGCFDAGTLVHVPVDERAIHHAIWTQEDFSDDQQREWEVTRVPSFENWAVNDMEGTWAYEMAVALATPRQKTETIPIDLIRIGQRVLGENPTFWEVDPDYKDPVQEESCLITATVLRSNGVTVDVELLRPTKDVQAMGIAPGVCIPLHLIELEVEGMALVHSVTASPPIPSGEGHVVTGRFVSRYADNRVRVTLTDGTDFIATEVHPVWLPEYQTWVPAGDLKNGDILDAIHGPGTVASVIHLGQGAPVYNIEVHGEHVYHVAATGVLVHNATPSCTLGIAMTGGDSHAAGNIRTNNGGRKRQVAHLVPSSDFKGRNAVVRNSIADAKKALEVSGVADSADYVNDCPWNGFLTTSSNHLGTHRNSYFLVLGERLRGKTNREEVISILQQLRDDVFDEKFL